MGLTINYDLKYKGRQAKATIAKARQLALDLPFEWVGPIFDLRGRQCDLEARRKEFKGVHDGDATIEQSALFSLLCSGTCGTSVKCPWNKHLSRQVDPVRLVGFTVLPGPGCEPADFGLALYPATIDWPYNSQEDARFQDEDGRDGWGHFSWAKFQRWCKRTGKASCTTLVEPRTLPTKLDGWRGNHFCKTQYANHPEAGGIANFLRCHISLITWLERAGKLPGMKVKIDDEGNYGPSRFTDDHKAAKPVYTWHRGLYSPAALVKEIGEWDQMLAAFAGAVADVYGKGEAPIMERPDFEQLEFRGCENPDLAPFLDAMKELAGQRAASPPSE